MEERDDADEVDFEVLTDVFDSHVADFGVAIADGGVGDYDVDGGKVVLGLELLHCGGGVGGGAGVEFYKDEGAARGCGEVGKGLRCTFGRVADGCYHSRVEAFEVAFYETAADAWTDVLGR